MTAKTELLELADRVEAGECCASIHNIPEKGSLPGDIKNATGGQSLIVHHALKGSLDAAKALHEAVLPGWEWFISTTIELTDAGGERWSEVFVRYFDGDPNEGYKGTANNPAAAWVAAILRAKAQEKEDKLHMAIHNLEEI
jgi:hypothetical protein